ncbi:hypothetical protein MTO96_007091 [Rhipicephalus appendiculatus]
MIFWKTLAIRKLRGDYLNQIYTSFNQVLVSIGVNQDMTRNFFAFKPNLYVIHSKYTVHLSVLNSVPWLSIVIILTVTDEGTRQVMPSSAWDRDCLPQVNETTMEDALSGILSLPSARVNYTLTVSLRLDTFKGVKPDPTPVKTLRTIPVGDHESFFFEPRCRTELFARDRYGISIYFVRNAQCAFAPRRRPCELHGILRDAADHKTQDERNIPGDRLLED